MEIEFLGQKLSSPLFVPSGIWPLTDGKEFTDALSDEAIGFVVLKTITIEERKGNSGVRVYEGPCGMLNSIGLANPGLDNFLSLYREYPVAFPHIISIMALSLDEIEIFAEKINLVSPWAIELNLSCPNVSHGEISERLISQTASLTYEFVKKAKSVFDAKIIAKLTPDITDIVETAYSAQEAGADGLALINTISATRIDIEKMQSVFDRGVGGLSGPAIFPIALRKIMEVRQSQRIDIPILGIGGVYNGPCAIEMALAGADVIGIGSAFLRSPHGISDIWKQISQYLVSRNLKWRDIVGKAAS